MIALEITEAAIYATAFRDGKPVATLVRARKYEKGPQWRVYDLNGVLLFATNFNPPSQYLAARIGRALNNLAKGA